MDVGQVACVPVPPRAGPPPGSAWSGASAFIITLPVAFSCIWALGFQTYSLRVGRSQRVRLPFLRCVRRKNAGSADKRVARLGAPRARRERVDAAACPVVYGGIVVLHTHGPTACLTWEATMPTPTPTSTPCVAPRGRSVPRGRHRRVRRGPLELPKRASEPHDGRERVRAVD